MITKRINIWSAYKVLIDGTVWAAITFFAFFLRLEMGVFSYLDDILPVAAIIIPLKYILVLINGHYKISWRYGTFADMAKPAMSVLYLTLSYYLIAILFRDRFMIPRTVPAIDALITIIAFLMIRLSAQIVFRKRRKIIQEPSRLKHVLVAGAGDSGSTIVKEMVNHPESGLVPVAFLDDDNNKRGQRINGVPVIGPLADLSSVLSSGRIDEVIIAMPSETGAVIRRILDEANKANIPCKTIPGLHEIISGVVTVNQLRQVQVEDLLRRKPVELDTENIKSYLKGRRVLVTGAGGSIGSEIVRQVCKYYPSKIILLGRGENTIHEIVRECQHNFTYVPIDVRIGDVRDTLTIEQIFKTQLPEVVFHAAAHKHVYLMEANPAQAVFNNVGGTRNLTDLSLKYGVKTFVNISTDKAINPTSVMGASKRIAETIVQDASGKVADGQCFVSVRFGNVLGSRGSVVPIFKEQIRRREAITITHPEMLRYFMTIPEASQLVLQAGALNMNGAVFVLDMGEPVKILDMARDLIRLSGLEPDVDIPIKFTGIRPGEKLYEELLNAEEGSSMTQHEKIFIARKNGSIKDLDAKLDKLFVAAESGDELQIRKMIKNIVPTYTNGGIKNDTDSKFKIQDSKK